MHCQSKRRFHEQACARDEFWDVISTLTQDLTKARNQLARLMKLAKPGGGVRLFGNECARRPLEPVRNYNTQNQPSNCHRRPAGTFGCNNKEYPHYKSPSRAPSRPVTFCGAISRHSPYRASCGRSPMRSSWSFEQPQDRVHYACDSQKEYSRAPEAPYSCDREDTHRSRPRESNQSCVQIF